MKSKSAFDAATFNPPEPTAADLAALERADDHQLPPDQYLELLIEVTRNLPASREIDTPFPHPFEL